MSRLHFINTLESQSLIAQRSAQAACWRLLSAISRTLDLASADIVEVCAHEAAAHVALLARQFPGLGFETSGAATSCEVGVRVLWAPDGMDAQVCDSVFERYDAVVIVHPIEELAQTLAAFKGFARIAAERNIGEGLALAVFGKGLRRDLFRARVRDPLAA